MHMSTRLSQNFTLGELCRSSYASRNDIDNRPSSDHAGNLRILAQYYLQSLRSSVGQSIVINSGYRCAELNLKIGGSSTSAHCLGHAADVECPGMSNIELAYRLMRILDSNGLKFDQIIAEFCSAKNPSAGWVHLGVKNADGEHRGQILHAYRRGGRTHYAHGLC